jgi:hypothetical protein
MVYEPAADAADTAAQDLSKRLVLAGFVDTAVTSKTSSAGGSNLVAVTARTPAYEPGAKASISLRKPAAHAAATQPAAAPSKQSTWTVSVADDDDELVDDEELLTEEDKQRPAVPDASDCSQPGKKACANCTCGRAEEEAAGIKVQLTSDMLENPQSACGSCGLGDAFRCSTCPFRGLPKFEMGKKVELGSDLLTADA